MRRQNLLLTAWLVAPIVVVGLLCYWIVVSLRAGPAMDAEPVGAGAGATGGANAIGEMLSQRRERARVSLTVEDRTGLATPDRPLLIGLVDNAWAGEPMSSAGEGRWTWSGEVWSMREGFRLLWVDDAGVIYRDPSGLRRLTISSGEQVERLGELSR